VNFYGLNREALLIALEAHENQNSKTFRCGRERLSVFAGLATIVALWQFVAGLPLARHVRRFFRFFGGFGLAAYRTNK
jgi:hypothetical protein